MTSRQIAAQKGLAAGEPEFVHAGAAKISTSVLISSKRSTSSRGSQT
jgi:hypothetical protein